MNSVCSRRTRRQLGDDENDDDDGGGRHAIRVRRCRRRHRNTIMCVIMLIIIDFGSTVLCLAASEGAQTAESAGSALSASPAVDQDSRLQSSYATWPSVEKIDMSQSWTPIDPTDPMSQPTVFYAPVRPERSLTLKKMVSSQARSHTRVAKSISDKAPSMANMLKDIVLRAIPQNTTPRPTARAPLYTSSLKRSEPSAIEIESKKPRRTGFHIIERPLKTTRPARVKAKRLNGRGRDLPTPGSQTQTIRVAEFDHSSLITNGRKLPLYKYERPGIDDSQVHTQKEADEPEAQVIAYAYHNLPVNSRQAVIKPGIVVQTTTTSPEATEKYAARRSASDSTHQHQQQTSSSSTLFEKIQAFGSSMLSPAQMLSNLLYPLGGSQSESESNKIEIKSRSMRMMPSRERVQGVVQSFGAARPYFLLQNEVIRRQGAHAARRQRTRQASRRRWHL